MMLVGGCNYASADRPTSFPSLAAAKRHADWFLQDLAEDCEFLGFIGAPIDDRDPCPDFIIRRGPRGGLVVELA